MFWRLCGKILLKACIPLVLTVGCLNYLHYLRGGDPMSLYSSLGATLLDSLQSKADNTAAAARDLANVDLGLPETAAASKTRVYAWRDEHGNMHYSSTKPHGYDADQHSYDPNANVVKRYQAPPKPAPERSATESADAGREDPLQSLDRDLALPQSLGDLPAIGDVDPAQIEAALEARRQMLEQY